MHFFSPINRDSIAFKQERFVVEMFKFYLKRSHIKYSALHLLWMSLGLLFYALYQSIAIYSIKPAAHYFYGMKIGVKNLMTKN